MITVHAFVSNFGRRNVGPHIFISCLPRLHVYNCMLTCFGADFLSHTFLNRAVFLFVLDDIGICNAIYGGIGPRLAS